MSDRTDEFRAQLDELASSTAGDRDALFTRVGGALMAIGIGIALVAYILAGGQDSGDLAIDALEHNELTMLAITGLAVSVTGAAVFLRFGLARFFRLWLLRQIYENRSNLSTIEAMLDRD